MVDLSDLEEVLEVIDEILPTLGFFLLLYIMAIFTKLPSQKLPKSNGNSINFCQLQTDCGNFFNQVGPQNYD